MRPGLASGLALAVRPAGWQRLRGQQRAAGMMRRMRSLYCDPCAALPAIRAQARRWRIEGAPLKL